MRALIFSWIVLVTLMTGLPFAAQAQGFETKANKVFLVDDETGSVLFAKGADDPVPSASLAKLMVAEIVFEAVAKGELSLDTRFPVSEHAWRTGGAPSGTATMFAALKSEIPVADLIKGVTVHFANDACIILAEGMDGGEAAFAARMTAQARALGMAGSSFSNATGLPDPGNVVTMRDMVTLARHVHTAHRDLSANFTLADFEWNKIRQRNRNPLITANIGVDGFVTGFAEGAGYSMVATMERDGRRVFLAVAGLATEKERLEETRKILDWSMANFERKRLFEAGDTIADAAVYGGAASHVALVTKDVVDVLVPVNNPDRLAARVVYRWPLTTPIAPGVSAGVLRILSGDRLLREVPLETAAAVEQGSLSGRALDALKELLFFWL